MKQLLFLLALCFGWSTAAMAINENNEDGSGLIYKWVVNTRPDLGLKVTGVIDKNATTSVTIPASLSLKNPTNPDAEIVSYDVVRIDDYAFEDCVNLTEVHFANRSTSLDILEYVFNGCTSLKKITIPGTVRSIGFMSGSSLEEVTIEEGSSLTELYSTFRECTTLKKVTLPSNINKYDNTFYGCTSLETVIFPQTVTSGTRLDSYVFGECTSLENITLPGGVTTIGEGCFWGCTALENISIPSSATSIGGEAFYGCESLETIALANTQITSIGYWKTFMGCTSLTSVTLPNTLTGIGIEAFKDCTSLTSINIPEGVTGIGHNAFEDCTNLQTVRLPSTLTTMSYSVFQNCESLTSVSLEATQITSIDDSTFKGCKSLTSAAFPSTLTSITNEAFAGCESLASLQFPGTLSTINTSAFSGCRVITNISVTGENTNYESPAGSNALVKLSGSGADYWDQWGNSHWTRGKTLVLAGLNTVIPNDVEVISSTSYSGRDVTTVEIPSNIKAIEQGAFAGCNELVSIEVATDNQYLDSRDNCNGIISYGNMNGYNYRAEVTLVAGCKTTVIPNSVKTILENCFAGITSLSSIELPASITGIRYRAFKGCSGLKRVVARMEDASSVTLGSECFSGIASDAVLMVPGGTRTQYIEQGWGQYFASIEEIPSELTVTLGEAGIATYSNVLDLNFPQGDDLRAYIASGFNPTTSELTLTRVFDVPAKTGLVLKGTPGSYTVGVLSTNSVYANLLVANTEETVLSPTEGWYTNLILSNGEEGIAFYQIEEAGTLAAEKAYLQIPTNKIPASARIVRIRFNDEETLGISELPADNQPTGVYSLQGVRTTAKKGLYIVNGKKTIVK